MNYYEIDILIQESKSYPVQANTMDEAQTLALEKAIQEHPGMDVWLKGSKVKAWYEK